MSRPKEGNWSESNTNHFLDILLECKRAADGLYNGKSVTNDFLDHVIHEMIVRTRTTYEKYQVTEKHKKLKADWTAFRTLIETTGVGWNPVENTIDIPPHKREELENHPKFKKFLNKGLPRCDDMNELWFMVEATGDEQELLHSEFHSGEASPQPCQNNGKSKRKGKSKFHTRLSSSPYSRSLSGKSGSHSSKNDSHSTNGNNNISIREQAFQVYIDRCQSKAAADVWSLGRCLDEINSMKEIKDKEGRTPHQIMMEATAYFEDSTSNREAFMHWPHETRVWFVLGGFKRSSV